MPNIEVLQNTLQWMHGNKQLSKTFDCPIRKILELNDHSGMVVVLEPPSHGENNDAFIIDSTGEIRTRICIPREIDTCRDIYDVYYEGTALLFVVSTNRIYDTACLFDEHGDFIRSHLTK